MEYSDKLCYYSKSKNVYPGKGKNEFVKDFTIYQDLNNINNWRKILSNFYVEPFFYEENLFNSIEHAFQYKKIEIVDKIKSKWFTLESNHNIGNGNGKIAQKNRKLILLNKDELVYWNTIKDDVLIDITKNRLLQSEIFKNVLLLTNKAELWHFIIRKGIVRNKYLELLRDELNNN